MQQISNINQLSSIKSTMPAKKRRTFDHVIPDIGEDRDYELDAESTGGLPLLGNDNGDDRSSRRSVSNANGRSGVF